MSNDKKSSIDPNKSQFKGSKAKQPRKLNLSASLLHSREMRKVFGVFSGHKARIQTPGKITVGGSEIMLKGGVFFDPIPAQ